MDSVELRFASGQMASIEISMSRNEPRKMVVYGSNGMLEAEPFYSPGRATVTMKDSKL